MKTLYSWLQAIAATVGAVIVGILVILFWLALTIGPIALLIWIAFMIAEQFGVI